MVFNVLTIFPDMVGCFLRESIVRRAIERGIIKVNLINIRDYSEDRHKKVDDYPYGGGSGMLIKPEPVIKAIESIDNPGIIIYLNPKGTLLNQRKVKELKTKDCITIICGHYEGIDQRIIESKVDEEISIGDYILSGGELGAAVLIDAITRELDRVLGNEQSREEESFDDTGLLEYEQYTRPAEFRGMRVPDVLLSGDHERIRMWRIRRRLINTLERRPELIDRERLSEEYRKVLDEILEERKNESNR